MAVVTANYETILAETWALVTVNGRVATVPGVFSTGGAVSPIRYSKGTASRAGHGNSRYGVELNRPDPC